jgi:5-methylcytosine-specific restriction endonuclease McrA
MTLQAHFTEQSINQLLLMHDRGQINLSPGFQRNSVWTLSDRRRLIQSIVAGKPLPNIFLYRRHDERGRLQYDVIDGKQRLETIFAFTRARGFGRQGFEVKLETLNGLVQYDWSTLARRLPRVRGEFDAYKIQTVEIEGDLNEIIDVFLSINSTGKKLTSGEKRHARFYNSQFLRAAERLVRTYKNWLLQQKVLTQGQLDRMKGVELFSELLMSIHAGGVINKKTALDRAIGNDRINARTLDKIVADFKANMNLLRKKFPRLRETRLRNSAELYSLFMVLWEMRHGGLALKDRRADAIATQLLIQLSTGVDRLREHLRRATLPKDQDKLFSDYLLTVQGDTDSAANRERRRAILKNLLWSLYREKDEQRLFTVDQRRILWHSTEEKVCRDCGRKLTWDDLSVDHVRAHSRGGVTTLKNARLLHKACNARKGNRVLRGVRRRAA